MPVTVGEVLVRLTETIGTLGRASLPIVEAEKTLALTRAQQELLAAVGTGEPLPVQGALLAAQQQLAELYETVKEDDVARTALGFPAPELLAEPLAIEAVDVEKVCVTFSVTGKQILTSLAFPRAANAKSYWLHEVRHFKDNPSERVEDPLIESHTPLFDRVRLVPGERTLRIKARNLSTSVLSDEFTIKVPESI